MTEVLKIGDRIITSDEIVTLLAGYQLLPQFLREVITDQAIADITCSTEEQSACLQQFYQKYNLANLPAQESWMARNYITPDQLTAIATRKLRIDKYKRATWGNKLESYFMSRKSKMDRAIYSLIRTQDLGIAQELYFRIREEEESFADMAREYSQGPEAQTGGLVGPVELGSLHPQLSRILSISQPGQVWAPVKMGQWAVIVRLEKLNAAQLDEQTQQVLLEELFKTWLDETVEKLGPILTQPSTVYSPLPS